MGQIVIAERNGQYNNDQERSSNETGRSISMFDWQYQVQKKMQHPKIINYSDAELTGMQCYNNNNSNIMVHDIMPPSISLLQTLPVVRYLNITFRKTRIAVNSRQR